MHFTFISRLPHTLATEEERKCALQGGGGEGGATGGECSKAKVRRQRYDGGGYGTPADASGVDALYPVLQYIE